MNCVWLVIFTWFRLSEAEVVSNFLTSCSEHFYMNTPPAGVPSGLDYKKICQRYEYKNHFATLYDTDSRIPVYSAFQVTQLQCPGNQPNRRQNWFVEPQLSVTDASKVNMETAGRLSNTYKVKQALNIDYEETSYDRGHLNPNFYQCDAGRHATFTLTNAVPQDPCFNRVNWKMMEEKTHDILSDKCNFPGARRFVVTGATPSGQRIPQPDDQETDNQRELNRVVIPDTMWSAVCCDSSQASLNDKEKGFSFGYFGNNEPESHISILSISALDRFLSSKYSTMSFKLFKDVNIRTARGSASIRNCGFRDAKDEMDILKCAVKIQEFHYLSKGLAGGQKRTFTSLMDYLQGQCNGDTIQKARKLMQSTLSLNLDVTNPAELVNEINPELSSVGLACSVIPPDLPTAYHLFTSRSKRSLSVYNNLQCAVESQNQIPQQTTNGDFCRSDSDCARHRKSYSWCYTDWKNNWGYCAESTCAFHGSSYTWCSVGNTWNYCVPSGNMVTVGGRSCLPSHQCGLHGQSYSYSWCYTDNSKSWGYCCSPWHTCDYHGKSYKWCWTGLYASGVNWQYCGVGIADPTHAHSG